MLLNKLTKSDLDLPKPKLGPNLVKNKGVDICV